MSEDLNYFIGKLDKRMNKIWWFSIILALTGFPLAVLFPAFSRISIMGVVISMMGIAMMIIWFIVNNKIETLQKKL